MNDKCFVDSNIWLYYFTKQDSAKKKIAEELLVANNVVCSSQVVNEVVSNLLSAKLKNFELGYEFTEVHARKTTKLLYAFCSEFIELNEQLFIKASKIRENVKQEKWKIEKKKKPGKRPKRFSYWDSCIVAAAILSGAGKLYSEDLHSGEHSGEKVEGILEIINPFS